MVKDGIKLLIPQGSGKHGQSSFEIGKSLALK